MRRDKVRRLSFVDTLCDNTPDSEMPCVQSDDEEDEYHPVLLKAIELNYPQSGKGKYWHLDALHEATNMFEEARIISEAEYGPHHSDTLGVYRNLIGTYDVMGRGDAISPVSSYNGAQFDISILLWKARSAFIGIMAGFTIAIMLIALFGTVLLWMYGSVWTTAFFALCGGMTFVFSHERFDVIPPGGCFDGVSSHSNKNENVSKNENVGGKEGSFDK
ncbi:hypothetical protein POM88_009437 [Heracleum sosnowskyi]|uniref:Uncharacterized protein n=1 Tax=Heracleum sosnowskyi TaxID=360622 RepID=A0AAD8N7I2_9APIA|nr:hypothetical protein POM88_009437 [Heracleum sosnowskyi]